MKRNELVITVLDEMGFSAKALQRTYKTDATVNFISSLKYSVDGGASFQNYSAGPFGYLARTSYVHVDGVDLTFFSYGAVLTAVP